LQSAAEQIEDFVPHRLALGVRGAHVTEALGPAHHRGGFDWNIDAGNGTCSPGHYLRHGRDRVIKIVERGGNGDRWELEIAKNILLDAPYR
jgi:hypothetical protein